MAEKALECYYHTGHEARIENCEESIKEIFPRLLSVEKIVWKAAGSTGIITGIVIVLLERWLKG